MVEESAAAHPGEPRVSTGIESLDAMLDGGLVARRPYLVVGPSGTGKTTLGLQFLCEGVRRGERVLLVTLEEPPNEARVNHRGLAPNLDRVDVFDAIPDIMRYERTPFKDIASVRHAIPFGQIPLSIRLSPELASVEVTITALEQMLRTEVLRKGYTRLVVDSLTALQYFCMKGFDPIGGAQAFLRFLSELRVTTILTVEAPLEDVETPERMLARGEIRLFRWELDGSTVRAVGVEKFRGSSHDVRLHPYRIGPQGIDINLEVTISRDTRQIIEPILRHPAPAAVPAVAPFVSSVTPLIDEVRDLVLLGAEVEPARAEIESALAATNEGHPEEAQKHLSRVSSLVIALVDTLHQGPEPAIPGNPGAAAAFQRILARADSVRTGVPPTNLPPQSVLQVQLGALLSLLPAPPVAEAAPAPPVPEPKAAPTPPEAAPPTPAPPPAEVAPPAPPAMAAPVPEPEVPLSPPRTEPVPEAVAPPPVAPAKVPETEPLPPAPPEPAPVRVLEPAAPKVAEPPPAALVPPETPAEPIPATPEPSPVTREAEPVVEVPLNPPVAAPPIETPPEPPPPVPEVRVEVPTPPVSAPPPEPIAPSRPAAPPVVPEARPPVRPEGFVGAEPATKVARARPAKPLPPPPKPRVSVGASHPAEKSPSGALHRGAAAAAPPPLPKASTPEWLTHPPPPVPAPSHPAPVGHPPPAAHAAHHEAAAAHAPPAAAKRRRKPGAVPTGGKKATTAPRVPPAATVPAEPAPAAPPPVPEAPHGPGPGRAGAEPAAKPKRRASRKRKAPPVVSAEVEPMPSDEPDDPAATPAPPAAQGPAAPREG